MSENEYANALPMRPVETEPPRTRRSTTVYTDTVRKFYEGGDDVMEIDLFAADIKAPTLRMGLQKAIADEGLGEKIKFSIYQSTGKAYLKRLK